MWEENLLINNYPSRADIRVKETPAFPAAPNAMEDSVVFFLKQR